LELTSFSNEILSFLFLVAVVAGFIDTLAGGGGLLALPALILSGVPPLAALGTNKLQGSFGTATATYVMFKKQKISWSAIKQLAVPAFLGAFIGAVCVQFIDTALLSFIIPSVLLIIALYFLISPTPSRQHPQLPHGTYRKWVVPVIGYYDGMFGPGTGSFFALSGVLCRGLDLISATAIAKPLNFATNIASLLFFIWAGQVIWIAGIIMIVGQILGAWLGAHCLLNIKPLYIRVAVVLMCCSMLIKYLYSLN
jgi:uncharacterized membrane protein YfcA